MVKRRIGIAAAAALSASCNLVAGLESHELGPGAGGSIASGGGTSTTSSSSGGGGAMLACDGAMLSFAAPEFIAPAATNPRGLVLAGSPYWIDGIDSHASVKRMILENKQVQVLAGDSDGTNAVAPSPSYTFYSAKFVIKPGGNVYGDIYPNTQGKTYWATNKPAGARDLVYSGSTLFWVAEDFTLYRITPSTDGQATYLGAAGQPVHLAAQTQYLFYSSSQAVHRQGKNPNDKADTVADAPALAVAVDKTRVVWTTSDGFVRGRDVALAAPAFDIAKAQGDPLAVATTDDVVYWLAADDGKVFAACPKAGAVAVVVAGDQSSLGSMAADKTGVYWTASMGGQARIMRALRK